MTSGVYDHTTEEYRRAISISKKGKKIVPWSEERKRWKAENHFLPQGPKTKKHKNSLSEALKGGTLSEEHRIALSAAKQGVSLDEWDGFRSFEPYCHLFTEKKKEEIRNRDHRVCVLCGKPEFLNGGQKLSVHHIDGNKMQGCSHPWYLASLCDSCHKTKDTDEKEFLIATKGGT